MNTLPQEWDAADISHFYTEINELSKAEVLGNKSVLMVIFFCILFLLGIEKEISIQDTYSKNEKAVRDFLVGHIEALKGKDKEDEFVLKRKLEVLERNLEALNELKAYGSGQRKFVFGIAQELCRSMSLKELESNVHLQSFIFNSFREEISAFLESNEGNNDAYYKWMEGNIYMYVNKTFQQAIFGPLIRWVYGQNPCLIA